MGHRIALLGAGRTGGADRTWQRTSLVRLDFEHPGEMCDDLADRPVYLGMAMKPDGNLRRKPQNLLLNLPLAGAN